jgi:hypothetical protein
LIIYSFGSGGCFQELALCTRLAKNYEIERVILVDQIYENQNSPTLNAFRLAIKTLCPEAKVNIYSNENHYFEAVKASEDVAPNVILAVDIGGMFHYTKMKETYRKSLVTENCVFGYHNTIEDKKNKSFEGMTTRIKEIEQKQ